MGSSRSGLNSDGENSLLQTLLDIMDTNDGVCFAKDLSGNYLYVNQAFVRLVNMGLNDIIGKDDFSIFPEQTAAMFQKHDKQVMEIKKSEIVEEIGMLDGRCIAYRTNKTPLLNAEGEVYGICGIALDITKEKQLEDERNELIEKLKIANNTKNKLFSVIAHDLRTPFNALIPLTEMLCSGDEFIKEQDKLSIYQELHIAASNTYELLENVLAWANERFDEVPGEKEKIDIKNAVENSIRPFQLVAKNKDIIIHHNLDENISILADGKSVQMIFTNLISNAIKFTPRGGVVNITSDINEDICAVTISDNGVGMSQETLGTLLEEGAFVSNIGTEGEVGTGIGLELCRELVSRNNGKLNVESIEGKGSSFSVLFTIVN